MRSSLPLVLLVVFARGAAGSSGGTPPLEPAKSPTVAANVRCVITAILNSSQSVTSDNARVAAMYYIGRLDEQAPKLDLEHAIENQLSMMTPADIQSERTRCGHELMERGRAVKEVGRAIAEWQTNQRSPQG